MSGIVLAWYSCILAIVFSSLPGHQCGHAQHYQPRLCQHLEQLFSIGEIEYFQSERLDHTQIDVDSMKDQLEYYKKGIDFTNTQLIKLSQDLYKINGRIWDTEGSIRAGLDDELGYDEIGKRAVQVRDLNRVRMSIKNDITELTGEGFKDCKMNYAGEG